jgi:hypothetical protein
MINAQLSAFAVANTNEAWQFVMEVRENPPVKWPLISRARVWWNTWRKIPPPDPSLSPYNGSHCFLTNETSDRKLSACVADANMVCQKTSAHHGGLRTSLHFRGAKSRPDHFAV